MGTIKIRGLEVTACHGVLDFEKVKPQKFIFDADMETDFYPAFDDDIGSTVNYAEVCELVERILRSYFFHQLADLRIVDG